VDNGRIVGSAAVAALHANDDFNSQLAKAKKEFIALSREIKN
jgi:hypothetical protein